MKIMIHSNAPWVNSGYGTQTRLLAPRLKAMGHDVAISAFYGLSGGSITWEGIPILPAGQLPYGADVVAQHAHNHGADVLITLMDFWKLAPVTHALRGIQTLAWLPVDCSPLGRPDADTLAASGARPVAMSRFGQAQLEAAGFPALYAPHGVDLSVFNPATDRVELRRELGVDEFFLIGICAANNDSLRKGWPEQFEAFRQFALGTDHSPAHPDARLMVHSLHRSQSGFALDQLAHDLGIGHLVFFSDQYAQLAGLMDDKIMADWYRCLDVLSAGSYAEGFGLPLIEAQACGTPVISTDGSAMVENSAGMSWGVEADRFWNPVHRAWWDRPKIWDLTAAYCDAYNAWRDGRMSSRRADATQFVSQFDADAVVKTFWSQVLDTVEIGTVQVYPATPASEG